MSDQTKEELSTLWENMMAARVDFFDVLSQINDAETGAIEEFNDAYRALCPTFPGILELDGEVDAAHVDDGTDAEYRSLAELMEAYPIQE